MKRYILIALCLLAFAYISKISLEIIGLARHQEVPVLAICSELALHIGAVVFPFISGLRPFQRKLWHYILWIPCILYVVGITINYLIQTPVSAASYLIGTLRLLGWIAIAVLFIRDSQKTKSA